MREENARLQSKICELSADLTALVTSGESGRLTLAQENRRLHARVAELERENLDWRCRLAGQLEQCDNLADELRGAHSELDRLRAENEALADCLRECADDLESEVNARASGELPRRVERDLEPVRRARELLAARAAREG